MKFIILALLFGCSEQGFVPNNGIDDGFGPDIEVSPERLIYGTLSMGETEVQTFRVTNVGTEELVVDKMILDGAAYTLIADSTTFNLLPDGWNEFDVIFEAQEADVNYGNVTVYSNDVDDPIEMVNLEGEGAIPEMTIYPNPYNYGVKYVGCEFDNLFLISSVGTEDLIIDSITYEDPEGQLSLQPITKTFPITMPPSTILELWIDFKPTTELGTQGTLTVESNVPGTIVEAYQTGMGVYSDWIIDLFEVPVDPPVDIIFAIDRSCSMDDDAISLASNFSNFISKISKYTSGWKIGVVTANNGCYNAVVESTTPNYENLFTSAVLSNNAGSNTEKLLSVVRTSLQAESGCNSGFLRAGALTHAIMVSDEPEQSSTFWSSIVSDMQALVADPKMLKLSAIAGDYPTGCGTAGPGTGYYEATMATGGEFLSICSNWSKNVDVLAQASLEGLLDFELSETPDPNSILVIVDGTTWLADWHYEPTTNSVVFDTEVDQGASIAIEYGKITECD